MIGRRKARHQSGASRDGDVIRRPRSQPASGERNDVDGRRHQQSIKMDAAIIGLTAPFKNPDHVGPNGRPWHAPFGKKKHRTKQKTIADCRPTGSFRICFRFPLESTVSIKGRRGKGCGPARIISLIFVFVHPSFYEIFGRLRLFAIRMPWRWSRERSRGPWQGCGSIRMQFPHESDYSVVLIQTLSLIEMQTLKWEWTTLWIHSGVSLIRLLIMRDNPGLLESGSDIRLQYPKPKWLVGPAIISLAM